MENKVDIIKLKKAVDIFDRINENPFYHIEKIFVFSVFLFNIAYCFYFIDVRFFDFISSNFPDISMTKEVFETLTLVSILLNGLNFFNMHLNNKKKKHLKKLTLQINQLAKGHLDMDDYKHIENDDTYSDVLKFILISNGEDILVRKDLNLRSLKRLVIGMNQKEENDDDILNDMIEEFEESKPIEPIEKKETVVSIFS